MIGYVSPLQWLLSPELYSPIRTMHGRAKGATWGRQTNKPAINLVCMDGLLSSSRLGDGEWKGYHAEMGKGQKWMKVQLQTERKLLESRAESWPDSC